MEKTKKTTLKDIALNLNLSINSVSHALRDEDDISEETKERVRQEAIRLGYQSKKYNLQISKSHAICLVFDNFLNPYFQVMGQKIVDKINEEKYDLVVLNTNEFTKVDTEIIKRCIIRKIDLVISFNEVEPKAAELARINNIYIILIGRRTDIPYIDSLYTDDYHGGEEAALYLISRKCHKLIYIYEINSESSERRMNGFLKVVNQVNIPYLLLSKEDVFSKKKLILDDNYDGIFVYNDRILKELFIERKVFTKEELENIHLIGFDNVFRRIGFDFPYPSIDFDYDEIALTTIEIINDRLRNQKMRKKDKHHIFDTKLITH